MDKNAIKSFAIESRRQMIESVKYQASLIGITSEGISEPISYAEGMETYDYGAGTHTIFDEDIHKRESLVKEVKNKGFDNVVEEVAYTWFNRIIAIRFMEVNDYLPTRTRVLSSESPGKIEPDIITEALELDFKYSTEELNLINKYKEENELDSLFQFLFIKQCNLLNEILPGLFEKTDDYMELLLDISFINENGIIRQLVDNILEDDFKQQVEIIGWLYQYYITDLNNLIYNGSYKKEKISKEMLPFATQIFTPDWVVQYMVENSLGKLWLENNPSSNLKNNLKYLINETTFNKNNSEKCNVEEIKIIDPCMGSGHILVYVFDVLMQIYNSLGYSNRDAVISILELNLFGLDVDDRAYQLAYFSVMMKAREYYRKIFTENISINLYSIKESNNISQDLLELIVENAPDCHDDLMYIIECFRDAKEYGSILNISKINFNRLINAINIIDKDVNSNLLFFKNKNDLNLIKHIIQEAAILSSQFDVVVTNPPYLNSSRFNSNLVKYAKREYKNESSDLSMMIYKKAISSFSKEGGYISFITTTSWMFLSKFEKLREYVLRSVEFDSIIDLGSELFDGKVGHNLIVAWVNKNIKPLEHSCSIAIKLSNYNYSNRNMKQKEFFNENNFYPFNQNQFHKIPGKPFAYWLNNFSMFSFPTMNDVASVKEGVKTANNSYFIRYWFEVELDKTNIFNEYNDSIKWVKHTKGGLFRKWYGNNEFLLNYENNGAELKSSKKASLTSENNFFKPNITWNRISSNFTSFRFTEEGFIPNMAGLSLYSDNLMYLLGFLNSNVSFYLLDIMNPTLNFPPGLISKIPICISKNHKSNVEKISQDNILLSKKDWNDYEMSWNFNKHPLIKFESNLIKNNYETWKLSKQKDFDKLKENEIALNRIFTQIYNLDLDNTSVDDKYVSITLADYENDIISFISYAVGCMFGRYSLDSEGIQFAGGIFDLNNYSKFIPDVDNIIPVLDTEYFDDDVVGRFIDFVKICFGEENLEENLDFIAGALNKKGKTSRECIRNYFIQDFYKNHTQYYKKCPIYWQFDSGKQNAFKCLIYMHRYDPSIVARVRTDYLHKTQKAIELNLAHCDNIINNSSNKSEISKATRDKTKYIKQLDEIKVYDEALRHMATQNIEIDLDDGVKVNYAKFQKIEVSIEGEKPKKINLLKNI